MRLNKIVKGMVVAAPMMILAACGSTSTTDADYQETQQVTPTDTTVQTGSLKKDVSPAEKMRLQLAALRQEHIIYFDFDVSISILYTIPSRPERFFAMYSRPVLSALSDNLRDIDITTSATMALP